MSRTITPMYKGMAYELTHAVPEYRWVAQGLTVVRDGYDVDGTRIHFVREEGYDGDIIANALIFSI